MKLLFSICYLSLFFVHALHAQNKETALIDNYLNKSKKASQKNIDSAFIYIQKGLKLAEQINNDSLLVKTKLQYSSLYLLANKLAKSDSLLANLNTSKDTPLYLKAQKWHNLATIQYRNHDFEKALELYIKAAQITEKAKNKKLLVNTYTNIGVINAQLQNLDAAQKYLEKAVALTEENELSQLQILINLSNIYKQKQLFEKFEKSIINAERLANKHQSKRSLSAIYNNLCDYYTSSKTDFNKAVFYGNKAISLKKELNQTLNIAIPYNNLGYTYLKNKEYQKSIFYLDSALPNAKGLLKSYIYNNLKDAHLGNNNYVKALHFAELKDQLKDSLYKEQQREKVADITTKYESEKKEQQINLLSTKNELQEHKIQNQQYTLFGVIFGILLLSALVFLAYKNQKTKQSLQEASLKHQLLQTQLNPHFLFHSLNNIQSFIYLNKKEQSLNYIHNYSKLMRTIFDSSSTNFISIKEDAEAMEAYLTLQAVNFDTTVDFSLETDENIADFLIPPMFIQPYIENAIQHGIKEIENGKILVKYSDKKDAINVLIFDNGKGIISKNNNHLLERKTSSNVIKERIKNLEKTHNYSIKQHVISDNKGTSITLSFPKLTIS